MNNIRYSFDVIENTKFPHMNRRKEKELDKWAGTGYRTNYSGHEIIEKLISMVSDDRKKEYVHTSNESSSNHIILVDNDFEATSIDLISESFDDPAYFCITENGLRREYEVMICENNAFYFDSYRSIDLKNGFVQLYSPYGDYFSKEDGENKIDVYVSHMTLNNMMSKNNPPYLIDNEIKEEFKNTSFGNILDVYDFMVDKVFPKEKNFDIYFCDKQKENKTDDLIQVKDGKLKHIKITRNINDNNIKIEQVFAGDNIDESLHILKSQLEYLRGIQNEMKLKLKQK